MCTKGLTVGLLAAVVLTSTAAADTPVPAATLSVNGWGGGYVYNSVAGWEFKATANVEVTALGVWSVDGDPLADAHPVGLWSTSGQLLASTVVPAGAAGGLVNDFHYLSVSPVPLLAGQRYVIADYFRANTPDGVAGGNSLNAITSSNDVTWLGGLSMMETMGSGGLAFPTGSPDPSSVWFFGPNLLLIPQTQPAAEFFYWKGGQNASWSTLASGQQSNWINQAGADTNAVPGSANDVVLTAYGARNFATTTLDGNFSVNSLTLNANGAATVAPGAVVSNTLTLGGGGLTVWAGAGGATISAPVALSAAQTWTNSSPKPLTISGSVNNGGNSLTVAGAGSTTISGNISGSGGLIDDASGPLLLGGANTYSGGTTVNAGVVCIAASGSLAGGPVIVNPGGSMNGEGSLQTTALSVGGSANVAAAGSLAAASVAVSGTGQLTVSGAANMATLSVAGGTTTLANGITIGLLTATGGSLCLAHTPGALVTASTADFFGSLGTVNTNPATGGRLAVTRLLKAFGGASFSYAGPGSFQVTGSNLSTNIDGLIFSGGTTTIRGSQPSNYQYFRFHALATGAGIQMDEVGFFQGSKRVLANSPVVYVDSDNMPIRTFIDGTPQNCNDANLATKFGSDTSNGYLVFAFNNPRSFTSYNWATGGDTYDPFNQNVGRNPSQWEVDGSNDYGILGANATWTQLSLVNTTYTPLGTYAANNAWQDGWALSVGTAADVSMLATSVTTSAASELVLNGTGGTAYLGSLSMAADLKLAGNSPSVSVAGVAATRTASLLDAPGNTMNLAIRSGGAVDVAAGMTLTLGLAVVDGTTATALVKTSPGTLVLTGSSAYTGGTFADAGTLLVTNSIAIAGGTSLTVGAGGTFVFDPSWVSAAPAGGAVAAVPEPSTLALLGVTAVGLLGCAWRRRNADLRRASFPYRSRELRVRSSTATRRGLTAANRSRIVVTRLFCIASVLLNVFIAPQPCHGQQGRPAVTGSFLGAVGGWVGDAVAGWHFKANATITVTSLGVWDRNKVGLTAPHDTGLWAANGTLLAEAIVPAGISTSTMINDFNYVTIPSVTLQAGQDYYVGSYFSTDQQDWVFSVSGNYHGTTDSTITWLGPGLVFDSGFTAPKGATGGPEGDYGGSFLIGSAPTPAWAADADRGWSQAANWSTAVPNGIDSVALMGNVVTAPRTITCDVDATLGNLTLSSSKSYSLTGPGTLNMQVSSGDASMTVTKGSHTILAPVRFLSNTDLSVPNPGNTLAFGGPLSTGGSGTVVTKLGRGLVTINAGASVNLPTFNVAAGAATLGAGAIGSIGTATIGPAATVSPSPILVDNATIVGVLNVSGGEVFTGPNAAVANANLTCGTLNTQGNYLAVSNSLTVMGCNVTFKRLGGGASFAVQGNNLVSGAAATINLSGVTLQATLPATTGTGVDIDAPLTAGSDNFDARTGIYTVSGGGSGMDNLSDNDQFHYVFTQTSGDCDARCRFLTQAGGLDAWQKAGIMIRASTNAGAAFAYAAISIPYATYMQYRDTEGASSNSSGNSGPGGLSADGRWLRLVRRGNTFTAYTELDGDANWTVIGLAHTPATAMNNSYLVGLAVTSHDAMQLSTATFSDVNFLTATTGLNLPSTNFFASQSGTLNIDFALTSTLGNVDLQGSGTTLSLDGVSGKTSFNNLSAETGSTATLANANGNSTSIALRGAVSVADSATLSVYAPIVDGDAKPTALTKTGNGALVLGGVDTYTGGTFVNAGSLVVTKSNAFPGGTSLIVGAGGAFVFDPSRASASHDSGGTTAVPEPSSLGLLGIGEISLLAYAWRRRKSA